MQLDARNRVYVSTCQVAMTIKMSERVQELISILRLLQHLLSTSSSNLLLQTSKPFIEFSWNEKRKTVSKHLKNEFQPEKSHLLLNRFCAIEIVYIKHKLSILYQKTSGTLLLSTQLGHIICKVF